MFDETPAHRGSPAPADRRRISGTSIDLEEAERATEEGFPKATSEAPGEPREPSVEEELILREISAEGTASREAEEIVLLDTPGDEEMTDGGGFDPSGESPLEEGEPARRGGAADVGPVPARALEAIGDGAFELDLDLQFDQAVPAADPGPVPAAHPGRQRVRSAAELDRDGAPTRSRTRRGS
jgi:hypothetical protein